MERVEVLLHTFKIISQSSFLPKFVSSYFETECILITVTAHGRYTVNNFYRVYRRCELWDQIGVRTNTIKGRWQE